jgi:hypothetical protein
MAQVSVVDKVTNTEEDSVIVTATDSLPGAVTLGTETSAIVMAAVSEAEMLTLGADDSLMVMAAVSVVDTNVRIVTWLDSVMVTAHESVDVDVLSRALDSAIVIAAVSVVGCVTATWLVPSVMVTAHVSDALTAVTIASEEESAILIAVVSDADVVALAALVSVMVRAAVSPAEENELVTCEVPSVMVTATESVLDSVDRI